MTDVAVSIRGLTKRYGRVTALEAIDIDINDGEVVGLIGQNGSGKSTLLRILSGVVRQDSGSIVVRGSTVSFDSTSQAESFGIGIVHQEQSLFGNLGVAENLFIGRPNRATKAGVLRWDDLYRQTKRQFEKIGLVIDPAAILDTLSFSDRQLVELVKVLTLEESVDHKLVILFDEPTSVLGSAEIQTLFRQIRRLRSRAAIVFVSHRMDEVMEISDRVYVMANGRCVAERSTVATNADELFTLMVGQETSDDFYSGRSVDLALGPPCLEVEGLGRKGSYHDVSFSIRAGEILSLTGVAGSGAEEVCRSLAGIEPYDTGRVRLYSAAQHLRSPSDAVRSGLCYVPAERKTEATIAGRSVQENMVLPHGLQFGAFGFANARRNARETDRWIATLAVKTAGRNAPIESLSGGNQQKVVLGRWMMSDHMKVLILDHPTRGLDPGAKIDVYRAVRDLASRGVSIIVIADTLEETIGLGDQIIVMKDGALQHRFAYAFGRKPEPADVVRYMV